MKEYESKFKGAKKPLPPEKKPTIKNWPDRNIKPGSPRKKPSGKGANPI